MTCGGGSPAKHFFASAREDLELGIGYILPLRDQRKIEGVASECVRYRTHQGFDPSLIPFALDGGHANPICVRLPQRDIIYWLHDDPENRIRRVAPSLGEFLSGLEESPY